MTVSDVTLIIILFRKPTENNSLHGLFISIPIIQPLPLIDFTQEVLPRESLRFVSILSPTFLALSQMFSLMMVFMVASAAAHASGFPPNVDPCDPGLRMCFAKPAVKHAPIGKPLPKPLEVVTTSGITSLS